MHGMTVMLTIWGTPAWANDGRGPNYAPEAHARPLRLRAGDRRPLLGPASRATRSSATTRSGTSPTRSASSRPPSTPRGTRSRRTLYAVICRFAYAGLKAGNPLATVAIGADVVRAATRSARPGAGSIAPGTFARLLAEVKPAVPFDAWAHHPYSDLGYGPRQRYRFPNVNLATLHTFEQKLDLWFHRDDIPIWISEYGFETRPGRPAA